MYANTKPREEYSYTTLYPDFDPNVELQVYISKRPSKRGIEPKSGSSNGSANGPEKDAQRGERGERSEKRRQNGPVKMEMEPIETDSVDSRMLEMGYVSSQRPFSLPEAYIRTVAVPCDPALDPPGAIGASGGRIGPRVEYDMDEQDNRFLEKLNARRPPISREIFEYIMTLFELEWYYIERKMPPKKKTAVEGEIADTDEQRCSVCDEADCNNSNAIVFCDGCDIAVHQDCYGIPFIPEGQWLCGQCTISRKHKASCIFCPNKSGALKRTDTRQWAHVLCALWIPEVIVLKPIYMQPIGGIDRIPKGRWKLHCYICKYKMGACIQCANKSCFQAFHPTCGRKARLYMKMGLGPLGALSDPGSLVAYCNRHTPIEHGDVAEVTAAVKTAQAHYENVKGEHNYGDEWEPTVVSDVITETKFVRKVTNKHKVWRTAQGTPAAPRIMIETAEHALQQLKFNLPELPQLLHELARYWALKRQMKRGAALIKRFQLALEMEPNVVLSDDKREQELSRLGEQIDKLSRVKKLATLIEGRENKKLSSAQADRDIANIIYFSTTALIRPLWDRIRSLDRADALIPSAQAQEIDTKVDTFEYTTVESFARDFRRALTEQPSLQGEKSDPGRFRQLAKLERLAEAEIEKAVDIEASFRPDVENGLPDFRNFTPSGLEVNEEVWSGWRIRRDFSPLTDEESTDSGRDNGADAGTGNGNSGRSSSSSSSGRRSRQTTPVPSRQLRKRSHDTEVDEGTISTPSRRLRKR